MRTDANTNRERAISAAILDALAAQVEAESEHGCLTEHQASALSIYAQGIRRVAEDLFACAQPIRKGRL